jgi:hypothetical protein
VLQRVPVMRVKQHLAVAVIVVGTFACGRHDNEQVSETKTTGAPIEPAPQAQPEAAPTTLEQPAQPKPPAQPKAEKAPAQEEHAVKPARKKAKPTVTHETGTTLDDEKTMGEPSSSDESKAKSSTQTPTTPQPVEPRTMTPPEPAPGTQAPEPPPYVNHSTVLGDGRSGTYTDGQGTYGGRSTWGTGGMPQTQSPPPSR